MKRWSRLLVWGAAAAAAVLPALSTGAEQEGGRDTLRRLEKDLRHSRMLTRHSAAEELTRIGGEEARRIFERQYQRGGIENKRIALVGLAKVAPEKSASFFAAELENPHWEVRWAAVYGLGWSGDPVWLPQLSAVAKDDPQFQSLQKRYPVREAAEAAIQRILLSPHWLLSFEEAEALARQTQKETVVFWFIPSAPWNQRMLDDSFFHSGFRDLKDSFVWVKLDAEQNRELARRFGVKEVPMLQLLLRDGRERERWTGYTNTETLTAELTAILKGASTCEQMEDRLGANPSDWALVAELVERYSRNHQSDRAVLLWEKMLQARADEIDETKRGEALFALGHYYGEKGEHEKAIRHLRRYCQDFPGSPATLKAQYCLALSFLAEGRVPSAEKLLRELAQEKLPADLDLAVRESLRAVKENRVHRRKK